MSFWNTLKHFGKAKADSTGATIEQALAKFDPEGMSEAGMRQLEENVDNLATETAQARQEWLKEKTEYDEISKLYEQRLQAAEILQGKVEKGEATEQSLMTLVQMLEDMKPEIQREKEEAEYAEQIFKELEESTKQAAEQVKNARVEFEQVRRELKRASLDKQRAERDEERAKRLAGIRQGGNQLGSAMEALKKNVDKRSAEADAAKMKARLFVKDDPEKDDPTIAAALAEASGDTKDDQMSITDRLAALKK